MGNDKKWTYLAELAYMCTDWDLIVRNIQDGVKKINIVNESADEESSNDEDDQNLEENFDLQQILDLNQVSIKQAQDIENIYLNKIRSQLEKELHNKLALYINPRLNGAVTWVACVICWFKLQNNVITKFNEKMNKFICQKAYWKNNFMQIVDGQTDVTTKKGAQQMFSDCFKDLADELTSKFKIRITDFLKSSPVLDAFNTNKVYDYMEQMYIKDPKANEYTKQIQFMKDPFPKFEAEVDRRRVDIIDDKISNELIGEYKTALRNNLRAFRNRVDRLRQKLEQDVKFRDPCSLFVIKKAGVELEF